MANKDKKVAVPEGGFQLDADDFKTGNFIIDGQLKKGVAALNSMDLTGDGISDVAQFAPIVFALYPVMVSLDNAVDFTALAEHLAGHPAVKDKGKIKDAILAFGKAAEQAGKCFQAAKYEGQKPAN